MSFFYFQAPSRLASGLIGGIDVHHITNRPNLANKLDLCSRSESKAHWYFGTKQSARLSLATQEHSVGSGVYTCLTNHLSLHFELFTL